MLRKVTYQKMFIFCLISVFLCADYESEIVLFWGDGIRNLIFFLTIITYNIVFLVLNYEI